MHFSKRSEIEPSSTVAINNLALEKKNRGETVFSLGVGEPVLQSHPSISDGAISAIHAGKTHYPPSIGITELRQKASEWTNAWYGTRFSMANTIVTCGGKFALYAACQALLEEGDEALIIAPYWTSYPGLVRLAGGVPKVVMTREALGWKVSIEDLNSAVTEKTRLLILNNASNPTGALYTRDEVGALLDFAKRADLTVLSDEVYSGLVYDGGTFVSCGSFREHEDRVVVVQSCSKHFAMTGWRVGFAFGPEPVIRILNMIQSQSTTGTSSISQRAAFSAIEHADEVVAFVRPAMEQRRNLFCDTLAELKGSEMARPASALYSFVSLADLSAGEVSSQEYCRKMLEERNVVTIPGSAFGAEGYVRLSFGGSEADIVGGLERLLGKNRD